MLKTMNRLEIDKDIRGLIRQMWKHCYRTLYSCQGGGSGGISGHGLMAYVLFQESGDGWFEENAERYGLKKCENHACCKHRKIKKICGSCGAGINGYVIYQGKFLKDQFSDKKIYKQ